MLVVLMKALVECFVKHSSRLVYLDYYLCCDQRKRLVKIAPGSRLVTTAGGSLGQSKLEALQCDAIRRTSVALKSSEAYFSG